MGNGGCSQFVTVHLCCSFFLTPLIQHGVPPAGCSPSQTAPAQSSPWAVEYLPHCGPLLPPEGRTCFTTVLSVGCRGVCALAHRAPLPPHSVTLVLVRCSSCPVPHACLSVPLALCYTCSLRCRHLG